MNNLHPGLILILVGIVLAILPQKASKPVTILGTVAAGLSAFFLNENAKLVYHFTDEFKLSLINVDAISKVFVLVFVFIAGLIAIYSVGGKTSKFERCASMIYAGSGISVVLSGDWISFIGFWELMAAASIYMVWAGGTEESRRSSFRYMIMHLFGGNLLLAGAVMVFLNSGSIGLTNLAANNDLGTWLVFTGVMVNCAMPPFHTWVPDSYPVASPESTLYMGSFTTKVAVYALIRFFSGLEWLVIAAAIVSVWAACMALIENNMRKLLSYHIISQLGMMVAALGCGGMGDAAATLHAAFNIMYKGVLLMGAGTIFYATGGINNITDLGGMAKRMPFTSVCFLIASLSIAGFPFTNGFASKGLIMESLAEVDNPLAYWLIMAAGVGTWLSITLKINYFAFFKPAEREVKCDKVPLSRNIAMGIGAISCILLGVRPDLSYDMLAMDSSHLFAQEHILEYIGLFAGATIPFAVMIKKMKPHEGINLDLDVFYRGGLSDFVFGISHSVDSFFKKFEIAFDNFKSSVWLLLRNPKKLFGFKDAEDDGEDDLRPLAEMVHVMVLFCIIAITIIFTMD